MQHAAFSRFSGIVANAFPVCKVGTIVRMKDERERTPFGNRVRAARLAAGMTQVEASARLGISQSTYADFEVVATGSSYTAQIARAFAVDSYWIATGEGEMLSDLPFDAETAEFARTFARLGKEQRMQFKLLAMVAKTGVNPKHIKPAPQIDVEKRIKAAKKEK